MLTLAMASLLPQPRFVLSQPRLVRRTTARALILIDPGPRWSAEETEVNSAPLLAKVRSNKKDPPNPAKVMCEAGRGDILLDEMELACCWLQYESAREELPLPRFRVTARPSKILGEVLATNLGTTDALTRDGAIHKSAQSRN